MQQLQILLRKCMLTAFATAVVLAALSHGAVAQSQEVIEHFNSLVSVTKDGQLDVAETIDMNFANDERHGIFRIIPVRYDTQHGVRTTALHIVEVTCDHQPVPYTDSRQFNEINIRIGDPDRKISGQHTYSIHYLVSKAINFFDNEPEIYWNATGNEWPFPIRTATAQFFLPEGVDATKVRAMSFIGARGARETGTFSIKPREIDFEAANLAPAEGLTFVLRLPPGSVAVTTNFNEFIWWFSEWWPTVVLPAGTLLFVILNWFMHGKDPGDSHIAGVDWNPPKELSPAEVGTLTDERCDVADIVSTLVDLAVRGYLRIEQQKSSMFFFSNTDYLFTKLEPPKDAPELKPHEKFFLASLFATSDSVYLSQLKYTFYTAIPTLRNHIYSALTTNGYFVSNPDTCRFNYMCMGGLVGLFGLVAMGSHHWPAGFGLIISALIVMMSSPFMPRRTRKGVDASRQCFGFRRFVQKAEKDRIKVLAKDDPTIFGRLLPYAMVLGAADQWAEAFHDLLTQPPSWYVPYGVGNANYQFSSIAFVNDLGDGMRTCASTFSAVPPSSANFSSGYSGGAGGFSGFGGGGFSGGGFGGGGGGSW